MLSEVIHKTWNMFSRFLGRKPVVTPSIPILFFGNSNDYFCSNLKVITVGLNPSNEEFPSSTPFLRFPLANQLSNNLSNEQRNEIYITSLNQYFHIQPYKRWFSSLEPLLNGLECSFYNVKNNRALHTDLCSPIATDPTWTKLTDKERFLFEREGIIIWHNLVSILQPDIILISVKAKYLEEIQFPLLKNWQNFHRIPRRNDYIFKIKELQIGSKRAKMVFGKAAQTPFGTVSTEDKRQVGRKLYSSL